MKDFYKVLSVRPNATLAEIKRAYREKVKNLHPDLTGDISRRDEFNEVVHAYRVLADAHQRSIFDESFFFRAKANPHNAQSFDYYKWLSGRDDYESRAKLIFYTLMHNKEDEAVAEFKRMQMNHTDFTLKDFFTREDFMDYGYILAEELVLREEFYDAFILLEQIIKMEYSYSYFYIFKFSHFLINHYLNTEIIIVAKDNTAVTIPKILPTDKPLYSGLLGTTISLPASIVEFLSPTFPF